MEIKKFLGIIFLLFWLLVPSRVFAQKLPSPTPTPFPTIIIPSITPKTPADYQQLELLHQLQAGHMPLFNMYLLQQLLAFPLLPLEWKLHLYYFLTSLPFVSSIHLSPIWLSLLVLLFPSLFLLTLILGAFIIFLLIRNLPGMVRFILSLFGKKNQELAFLELTFPANTTKSAYATEQLYRLLHTRAKKRTFTETLTQYKKVYSLEIASSRDLGIRYIMSVPKKESDVIHQSLLSYLPGLKVKEVADFLDDIKLEADEDTYGVGVLEFALASDFALPLQDQDVLSEHDPISFLTGTMTKLAPGELIAFQMLATPVINGIQSKELSHITKLRRTIAQGKPLTELLQPTTFQKFTSFLPVKIVVLLIKGVLALLKLFGLFLISLPALILDNGKGAPILLPTPQINISTSLDPYEQDLHRIVKDKLNQHLFETSIRVLIVAKDTDQVQLRAESILASVGPFTSTYQALTSKRSLLPSKFTFKHRLANFKYRLLSGGLFNSNPILSSSEVTDIYHFPYTDITKTEGLVKSKSPPLPAPLSMKKSDTNLDVVVGNNSYGGEDTPIGLTLEQRQRHTYVIGKTGMGKTEMLKSMIYQDMMSGKGLAVLDPHGDLFHELLRIVPKNRLKDVIVFNPADKEWPIGLNILSSGIYFSDEDEGHDRITSTTLAVFRKLTDEKYWGPRLEHILRNASMTALQTAVPSLFVIQKLLTNTKGYQKTIASTLSDPILKQFWESEFSLYGRMQQAGVVAPITNRLGKFITNKMSRNILLQGKSTINMQKIMDEGKILLVNLSKGELGEDQSFFFGSLIISLIQLAAYQRIHVAESKRRDFFLYVDEFQNFATHIFEELSSEGRKWHVPLIPSHQNIAQIRDTNLLKVVAGNADTIIALKSGPDDEKFILPFMEPEVEKGGIVNLPPYHFYMKVTNKDSEDAFSGETQLLEVEGSDKAAKEVIEYSRKHYAIPREEVEKQLNKLFGVDEVKTPAKKSTKRYKKQGL